MNGWTWAKRFASQVTFVKKIHPDGSSCQKCDFVWKQLEKDGLASMIDRVVVADERDSFSEGLSLAQKFNKKQAPFFVVEDKEKLEMDKVYDVYFKLKKEVFGQDAREQQTNEEILRGMLRTAFC
jgi:hypothetical protein